MQRGCDVDDVKAALTGIEFERHWQDFLLTGFKEWIPEAVRIALLPEVSQKSTPVDVMARKVLQTMISVWANPVGQVQTHDQLASQTKAMVKRYGGESRSLPLDDPYWETVLSTEEVAAMRAAAKDN